MKLIVEFFIPKIIVENRVVHYVSPKSHLNYATLCGIGESVMHEPTTETVTCFRCKEIADHVHKHCYVMEAS